MTMPPAPQTQKKKLAVEVGELICFLFIVEGLRYLERFVHRSDVFVYRLRTIKTINAITTIVPTKP
jgi:hypothetical protein